MKKILFYSLLILFVSCKSGTSNAPATDEDNTTETPALRADVACDATITANGPTTFCSGGLVTLSAKIVPGNSYQWFLNGSAIGGAVQSAYNVSVNGSYAVRVTATGCQTMSQPFVVTVNPKPGAYISAGSSTSFCTGGSVVLSTGAGTNYTYQWNLNGTPISGATNISYTANTSGSYTVTIFNGPCQNTSGASTVTVTDPPTAIITGSNTFPSGGSTTLSVSTCTGCTYQWEKGGLPISGATAFSYNVTQIGNYRAKVKLNGCTSTSSTVTVTESTGITATIGVVLNANTGTGYTYQWFKDGVVISGATSSSYAATTNGSYTVRITSGGATATSSPVSINNQ